MKKKLFRVAAVSGSLAVLLKGQLRYMNQYYSVTGIASEGPNHDVIRKNEGVRTISLRINRKINLLQDIVSLYELYRLFKREKPFIVHSLTPKAGLLSMTAAYLAGVPHRLHTFTGLIFPTQTGIMKKVLIFFDKVICYCATRIYPEGEGVKRDLLENNITKKKLTIIGNGNINGIDLNHFDPALFDARAQQNIRSKWGFAGTDFILCFVGRIVLDKGIVEMVTSFLQISKKHENCKLLLIGPFENEASPIPENIIHEIKNNKHIISAGWQKDVRPFLAISNIFVFPSYREGFPNVLLQSGAMGKYSIVTDINGSNEIIETNNNGTIIPVKNSDALTAAINEVYLKFNEVKANQSYRQLIKSKYDQNIVWQSQLKEYASLEKV